MSAAARGKAGVELREERGSLGGEWMGSKDRGNERRWEERQRAVRVGVAERSSGLMTQEGGDKAERAKEHSVRFCFHLM